MLINNLQKYKEKYSKEKRYQSIQPHNRQSLSSRQSFESKRMVHHLNNPHSSKKLTQDYNIKSHSSKRLSYHQIQDSTDSKVEMTKKIYDKNYILTVNSQETWMKTFRQNNFFSSNIDQAEMNAIKKNKTLKRFKRATLFEEPKNQIQIRKQVEQQMKAKTQNFFKRTAGFQEQNNQKQIKEYVQEEIKLKSEKKFFYSKKRGSYNTVSDKKIEKFSPMDQFMNKKVKNVYNCSQNQIKNQSFYEQMPNSNQNNKNQEASIKNSSISSLKLHKNCEEEQIFLQKIKFNQVFFCCGCLKYIFAIQKKLHYPKCENSINFKALKSTQRQNLMNQRLELLKQLSLYTKTKQKQINKLIQGGSPDHQGKGTRQQQYQKRNYLKLQQIEMAGRLIIKKLFVRDESDVSQIFCTIAHTD